ARLLRRIEDRKESLKSHKQGAVNSRKFLEARTKQEEAFTQAYRLIEKERQRAGGRQTLLLQFLSQFDTFVGPDIDTRCPWPVPLRDKVKALVLWANKGDSSEHKKILAAIRTKKKEADTLIGKHRGFIKEIEGDLRTDQALLDKTTGDTSGIEKRIAGHKR